MAKSETTHPAPPAQQETNPLPRPSDLSEFSDPIKFRLRMILDQLSSERVIEDMNKDELDRWRVTVEQMLQVLILDCDYMSNADPFNMITSEFLYVATLELEERAHYDKRMRELAEEKEKWAREKEEEERARKEDEEGRRPAPQIVELSTQRGKPSDGNGGSSAGTLMERDTVIIDSPSAPDLDSTQKVETIIPNRSHLEAHCHNADCELMKAIRVLQKIYMSTVSGFGSLG